MIKSFICIIGKKISIHPLVLIEIIFFISSAEQSRPNNADLFLLVLNNTSRSIRKDFEKQTSSSTIMAHRFQRNINNINQSLPSSAKTSIDSFQYILAERVNYYF